jgi:hypothetical protein
VFTNYSIVHTIQLLFFYICRAKLILEPMYTQADADAAAGKAPTENVRAI